MNFKTRFSRAKNISPAVKASFAYTVCSIIQKTLSLITTPLFSRLLTLEQYGQLSIYNTWSALLTIVITLNLGYGSFNRAMVKFEKDRDGYISSIQTISLILSCLFLIIYAPFSNFFNGLFSLSTPLVLLLVGEIVCQFGLMLWMGKNRYEYKYKGVVLVTMLVTVLSPIMAFLAMMNTEEKGVARIIAYAVINIVVGGIIFIRNAITGKKLFSKKYIKYALSFNIPLLIYYASQLIFNESDKIMIEKLIGIDQAGLYSLAYSFALILTFVLNAITNSYVPWLYEKIKEKKHKENRGMAIIIAVLMCVLVGGLIWATPEAIFLMGGEKYLGAIYVVPPISISLILLLYTTYFTEIQFYYEMKYKLIVASIGSALLNIVLNYLLIPSYGIVAAGYTTLASYVVFCLSNYFVIKHKIGKGGELEGIYNLKILPVIFVLFVALSYVGVLLYPYIYVRYAIIGVVLLLLLIFRKKVTDVCKKIIKKGDVSMSSIVNVLKKPLIPFVKLARKNSAKRYLRKKFVISGKCKVLFICQCQHVWDKTSCIVERFIKNESFEVTLLIVEDEGVIDNTVFENFAKEHNVKFEKYYKGILKKLKPNIIFYPRPYDYYLPRELRTYYTVKKSKLIYIPYGYSFMALGDINLNEEFTQNISILFADNSYAHDIFTGRIKGKNQFSYNLGCPYLENLLNDYQDKKSENNMFNKISAGKTKIIWTPRWSVDENVGGSNFFRYIDNIFDYVVSNDDYKFVFRPHPYAFSNFVNKGLMTQEQKDDYLRKITESANSIYDDNSEYLDTLLDADIMVTDASSIIAEYALTGKPIIFCHNEKSDALNDVSSKFCKEVFYNAYSFDDIKGFLENLKKGVDPLKARREKFCKKFKRHFSGVNKKIENIVEEFTKNNFIRKGE